MLTKDQILAASDLKSEVVDVPEWGGTVMIRAMRGSDREELEEYYIKEGGELRKGWRSRVLVMTLVGDDGERLFTMDDLMLLSEKSSGVIERLYDIAARISGIAANREENPLGQGQSADSGSD